MRAGESYQQRPAAEAAAAAGVEGEGTTTLARGRGPSRAAGTMTAQGEGSRPRGVVRIPAEARECICELGGASELESSAVRPKSAYACVALQLYMHIYAYVHIYAYACIMYGIVLVNKRSSRMLKLNCLQDCARAHVHLQ